MDLLLDFNVTNGIVTITIIPANIYSKSGCFPSEVREQFQDIKFDYFMIDVKNTTTATAATHKLFQHRFYSYVNNGAFHHRMGALVYKGGRIYTCGPVQECHDLLQCIDTNKKNFLVVQDHFRYCDFEHDDTRYFSPCIVLGNGLKFLYLEFGKQ